MQSKEEKAYWEGYIQKQNEAMEICKQCKYIKKVKQLECDKQKLIEKLEEEHTNAKTKYSETLSPYQYGKVDVVEEILSILKGENDELK